VGTNERTVFELRLDHEAIGAPHEPGFDPIVGVQPPRQERHTVAKGDEVTVTTAVARAEASVDALRPLESEQALREPALRT
jgi:hypothetical protein